MRRLSEEKPVLTPHELFKNPDEARRAVAAFYSVLGEAEPGQTIFADREDEVARGFLHLTWDITASSLPRADRRSVLSQIGDHGVSPEAGRHFVDHARTLGSTLVARYTPTKVAQVAASVLLSVGVGQVIMAK